MVIIEKSINSLNEFIGQLTAWLILPMVGVVFFEVMMRYVFNTPTSWGFETTTFIYGIHYVLGFGYTLKHNGHVCIDVFEAKLPQKSRTMLRILTNIIMFIPTIGLLTFWSILYAITSWQQWEHSSTAWAPPLYPIKTLMAIGFFFLFLQGTANLIHDLRDFIEL